MQYNYIKLIGEKMNKQDLLKKYPKSKPATLARQKLQTLGA